MTRPKPKGQQRLDKDASVGIVGCGIAGLSAAISLVQAGFTNVTIFERDTDPLARREGFGMTLTYNPQGPLAHCGVLEQVAQQDCPSRSHYIFDPTGKVLGYYGNAFLPSRGFGQRGNMRIPRQVLQKIMTERFLDLIRQQQQTVHHVSCSSIQWGQSLRWIRERTNEGKVELAFNQNNHQMHNNAASSMVVSCDLVIAADGVCSSVVSMLAPQCQPRPMKVMIILGIAEGFHHPLLTERGFYTVGDGKHRLFTMPYAGNRYTKQRRIMWQLSYRYDDNSGEAKSSGLDSCCRDPEVLLQTALDKCAAWHEPVPSLIRSTPLETVWGT
jgi:2-polyprenyl-6-methoxyphenol hydroxylase-like FAD-dependent oxidoreductase